MIDLRPSRATRSSTRLLSAALGAAITIASLPASAAVAPSAAEIERLYSEGDKKNGEGDFTGAAESWTRALVLLPEEGANQATRENLLLNVLDAHINAYKRLPGEDGKKNIAHLQEGKKTYELYLQQYRAVYGSGRAISSAVQQKSDELNAALAKAEEENKVPEPVPEPTPDPIDGPKPTPDTPVGPQPQNNGMGLIVGGSITAALGLGGIGLLIGAGVASTRAEKDYELAQDDARALCSSYPNNCNNLSADQQATYDDLLAEIDDADTRGRRANALQIVGGVMGGVLLAGGAAMLAIGIKRHRTAKAMRSGSAGFAPAFGPTFAGAVLRGRF
jgi:hypothetical protein